jgi:hypothetical protein
MLKKIINKKCLYCDKEFTVFPYRESSAKFCSRKCRAQLIMPAWETRKGKVGGWSKGFTKITHLGLKKLSESRKGEGNPMWQGGITPLNKQIHQSDEYKQWRTSVFERDNYTCQKTGIKGGKLHPHHIKNFSQFPELRFNVDNGITLSEESHIKFHKIYGRKNNSKKQIKEFTE